jgi:hypothetical protein
LINAEGVTVIYLTQIFRKILTEPSVGMGLFLPLLEGERVPTMEE